MATGTARVTITEGSGFPLAELIHKGSPELMQHMNPITLAQLHARATTLSPLELELIRVRSAYLLGCLVCVGLRPADLVPSGRSASAEEFPEAVYEHILNPDWEGYGPRERLILELIERFAEDHQELRDDDELWARMAEHFDETERVDLCLHIVGPAVGQGLMAKVLLGLSEICDVMPAKPLG